MIFPHRILNLNFRDLSRATGGAFVLLRWLEAGKAPQPYLQTTHESALEVLSIEDLKKYAIDLV